MSHTGAMAPLYSLFCVTKPTALPVELFHLMRRVGTRVYGDGGVVTQVASYGNNELAYPIKRAGETFNEGEMWQMGFHASPGFVKDLRKLLSEDHRVLRQLVTKEPRYPPLYYFSAQAIDEFLTAQKTGEELDHEADLLEKERAEAERAPGTSDYFNASAVIDDLTAKSRPRPGPKQTTRQKYGSKRGGEQFEPEEVNSMADLEEEVNLDQIVAEMRGYQLFRKGLDELLADPGLAADEREELVQEQEKMREVMDQAAGRLKEYQEELLLLKSEWVEELEACAKREEEVDRLLQSGEHGDDEKEALEQLKADLKKRGSQIEDHFHNVEAYSQYCLDLVEGKIDLGDLKRLENLELSSDSDTSSDSDSDQ